MKTIIGFIAALFLTAAVHAQNLPFPGPWYGIRNISTPVTLGTGLAASGTTLNITTTANAPVGSMISVGCISNSTFTGALSVSDGTNTYVTAFTATNSAAVFNSGLLAAQLSSGSTLTVTSAGGWTSGGCDASYVTGISSTTTKDQTVNAAAATATTGTLAQANELAYCLVNGYNSGSPVGTVTFGSGFTLLSQQANHGTDVFTTAWGYKIVAATTAVTCSFTVSGASPFPNTTVVTYKGN